MFWYLIKCTAFSLGSASWLDNLLNSDEQSCSSKKDQRKHSGILSFNLWIFCLSLFVIPIAHHFAEYKLKFSMIYLLQNSVSWSCQYNDLTYRDMSIKRTRFLFFYNYPLSPPIYVYKDPHKIIASWSFLTL